jgi:hypothetical protein
VDRIRKRGLPVSGNSTGRQSKTSGSQRKPAGFDTLIGAMVYEFPAFAEYLPPTPHRRYIQMYFFPKLAMKNITPASAYPLLNTDVYYSVDCSFAYLKQVNHYLSALGYKISEMSLQKSYFLGYTLRLHFSEPVPSLIMDVLTEYLAIENPAPVYLQSN